MIKMLTGITLTALAATAATVVAWAQGDPGSAAQASPPEVVLSTMHQMNQLEMNLGQLAEQKGASEDVRAFGERLYRDHRFGDRKVTGVAAAQDLQLLPPPQLPAAPKLQSMKQKAQQLQGMGGPSFDGMFLQMMVQSHEMATSMLADALDRLPSGPTRQLVSRLLPVLQQHLELARELQGETAEH
jgi:putative membrane protein